MKKADNKNKNQHVISFRVNGEERAFLLQQARKCGGNLSQLIREKLEILSLETGSPR